MRIVAARATLVALLAVLGSGGDNVDASQDFLIQNVVNAVTSALNTNTYGTTFGTITNTYGTTTGTSTNTYGTSTGTSTSTNTYGTSGYSYGGYTWPSYTKVDCAVSAWSNYSSCSAYTGYKKRTRSVVAAAQNGGAACPCLEESVKCAPKACVVSDWSTFSACDDYSGTKTRTRTVLQNAEDGGTACPALSETAACDKIDCVTTDWSAWGACIKGQKTRTRTVTTPAKYGAPPARRHSRRRWRARPRTARLVRGVTTWSWATSGAARAKSRAIPRTEARPAPTSSRKRRP